MSDYGEAIDRRLNRLDRVRDTLSDIDNDPFLSEDDAELVSEAFSALELLAERTSAEGDLLATDWVGIEDRAARIIEILTDIAESLQQRDLVDFEIDGYRLRKTLDNEPNPLTDLRKNIEIALNAYYDVLMAARNALEDKGVV
jgi:hypothetical protein